MNNFDKLYKEPKENYKVYSGTIASDTTLSVLTDIGRYTYNGEILNDGSNNIGIQFSKDGVTFGDTEIVMPGEKGDFTTYKVHSIKLIFVAPTNYRVVCW
jgi:hypothetical protein